MKRDLIEKASKQRPLAVQLPLIFFLAPVHLLLLRPAHFFSISNFRLFQLVRF